MRPLSIVYVVLALLMIAASLGARVHIKFLELERQVAANKATNTSSATVTANPPFRWQRGLDHAFGYAGFFAVTVFCGEAYRRYRSRVKKVGMLSVRLSNAYILLMLLTLSPVVAAFYRAEWGQSGPSKNPQTAISLLQWASVFAGAFVVIVIGSEIRLRRCLVRTSNAHETRNTDEYPDLASQQSPDAGDPTEMNAAEIRRSYLKHEASVKSVGLWYILVGLIIAITSGLFPFISSANGESPMSSRIVVTLGVTVGAFVFVVGLGLKGLKSWTQTPTVILSVFGLLGFPLVTIISAYILYLVFCAKGETVFSPEYKQIIAETPEIKCKTSIVVWICLGLLIVVLGLGIVSVLVSSLSR